MKILNTLLWPFLLPVLLLVYLLWPKSRPHFSERLGLGRQRPAARGSLLVHVASLGEARAARPLIASLSKKVPLFLTTMTQTGREALVKAHPGIPVSLAPLDLPGLWGPFLRSRRIRGILLFETEIWPAMLGSAREQGLSVALVNGRLSSRSFGRYRKLKWWIRPVLECLDPVTVQSDRDAARFLALGARPEAIHLTGNLKWDADPSALAPERAPGAGKWLGTGGKKDGIPLLRILGSSVHPEEALVLVRVWRRLVEEGYPVSLVLAFRHLETLPAFLSRLPSSLKVSRRTDFLEGGERGESPETGDPSETLFLLDTYGELGAVTGLADAVFVGGTLDPVGGHSPVEAAAHGKPILWGPCRDHIADLAETLSEAGAAIEATDEAGLREALTTLVKDGERRVRMGHAARAVFEKSGGALGRTLAVLDPFVEGLFPEGVPSIY